MRAGNEFFYVPYDLSRWPLYDVSRYGNLFTMLTTPLTDRKSATFETKNSWSDKLALEINESRIQNVSAWEKAIDHMVKNDPGCELSCMPENILRMIGEYVGSWPHTEREKKKKRNRRRKNRHFMYP